METMYKIKLVLLGEIGTGKSNILSRMLNNTYDEKSPPTIGADFGRKEIILVDKSILKLQFWDTSSL
jgi:Ras-related protein Rab-11A